MPSAEQLRSRLLKKLSELFQLDQPDLDFGFYRIMHAKAQEVQDFIGTDLLKTVTDAFGNADETRKAALRAAYEKAIQTAKDFGAPSPTDIEPVKKAKAAPFAVPYNGSNNLPNLKLDDESWKVRLIEEAFMKRMWNTEGV